MPSAIRATDASAIPPPKNSGTEKGLRSKFTLVILPTKISWRPLGRAR
jgi:hypothetical protein